MKVIVSISLALACALATAIGGITATEPQAYKTQLIRVVPVHRTNPKPKSRPHRVNPPRLPRVSVRASRSFRRAVVYHFTGATNYGRASWYTGNFGACGKPLRGYYAASRTLPCGSHVLVSHGGHSVVVTILDRGPYSGDRVLDLSRSAFEALAPVSEGVIGVYWKVE